MDIPLTPHLACCPPCPVPALQLNAGATLALHEASRLVKLLPYLPGLPVSSILCQAVFDKLVQQANRLSLFVLVSRCCSVRVCGAPPPRLEAGVAAQ